VVEQVELITRKTLLRSSLRKKLPKKLKRSARERNLSMRKSKIF
jgi:hypothetical protein